MGLKEQTWALHGKSAIAVEGAFELRDRGLHYLLNIAPLEIDQAEYETKIENMFGPECFGQLIRIRDLIVRDPYNRNMTAVFPYKDRFPWGMIHVLMIPCDRLASKMQFRFKGYFGSISLDTLEATLEFFKATMAWIMEPLTEFYWEDYDPVLQMQFGNVYKGAPRCESDSEEF
jgi:hypothetical protein